MIVDTMTKAEVMSALRRDFDNELMPYINAHMRKYEVLIRQRAVREKSRMIALGWESFESSNKVQFRYRMKGDSFACFQTHVAEFIWRGTKCYAHFLENDKMVVVFQGHCLDRYAQRVVDKETKAEDVFYKHLVKRIGDAFHVVLPCPKREASEYLVFADALFLGDYIVPSTKDDPCHIWCNTCISLNEAHTSQSGIIKSLHLLQRFIYREGVNPVRDRDIYLKTKKSMSSKEEDRIALIEFFRKYHMMIQLSLSFDIPSRELFTDEMEDNLSFIANELETFGVNAASLDPYGPNGFAVKGEIDYKAI